MNLAVRQKIENHFLEILNMGMDLDAIPGEARQLVVDK